MHRSLFCFRFSFEQTTETDCPNVSVQEAAQALIYAGMAGSKLDGIQDKVNEYLDRVEALHNASKERERETSASPLPV